MVYICNYLLTCDGLSSVFHAIYILANSVSRPTLSGLDLDRLVRLIALCAFSLAGVVALRLSVFPLACVLLLSSWHCHRLSCNKSYFGCAPIPSIDDDDDDDELADLSSPQQAAVLYSAVLWTSTSRGA